MAGPHTHCGFCADRLPVCGSTDECINIGYIKNLPWSAAPHLYLFKIDLKAAAVLFLKCEEMLENLLRGKKIG